jgi:hypothetical protein
VQHPARLDHRRVREDLPVPHVVAQVERDDLVEALAAAQVLLGNGPQAVAGPDRHQLDDAHAVLLG